MNLSELFIKKPIMTTLVMTALLICGIVSYFGLPVSDLPTVDYPVIQVTVSYPGASPATMASTVASPLEDECMQIPGLQSVISSNTEGQTAITLTFDLSRNVDLAAPDVQAAISRAQSNLPSDLPEPPTYSKTNPSDAPIVYIMVTSDTLTNAQLYDFGNRGVGQRISMINGVSQVEVWGAKGAVRVQVDPNKLQVLQLGLDEVAKALQCGTTTIPGGSLDGKVRTFSIEPQGQLLKAKDYDKLIVTYRNGAPVRLEDIATCVDSLQNDVFSAKYGHGGGPLRSGVVCLLAFREAGANTVAVSNQIRETLKAIENQLPGSVEVDIFYDRAEMIKDSVNDVRNTIFLALALVVLVIFLFLGRLSETIIPGIALPLSVIATFAVMYVAGFSLDNLSLMGLTLAVGFVVDDAIVVLENTVRLVEAGDKPLVAAIKSGREISGTVLSMTLSLVTVFVPLVFMGGVVGRIFREFAVTVVAAICCSGVISLTLTPMMCARMLKGGESKETKLQAFTEWFLGGIRNGYGVLLKGVLKHRFISVVLWIACLAGTFWCFSLLPKTFLPEGDSGAIRGGILVPLGTSTDVVRQYQKQIDAVLHEDPSVARFITVTGLQAGADQSTGAFYAVLKPHSERPVIQEVVQRLRGKMAMLPGGFVFLQAIPALHISAGGESTATGCKYSYTMSGSDRKQLYEAAEAMEQKMRALPGFVDVQSSVKLNMPQLNVKLLRDRASAVGLTAEDIVSALSLAYAAGKLTTYKTDVDQYYVIIELDKRYQRRPMDLSRIYVRSSTNNKLIPLGAVVECTEGVGPQDVPHSDRLNSATLSFNLEAGVPLGNATAALERAAKEVLTPGIAGRLQGEAEEFQEAVASLGVLVIVAVFVMYTILGILYESYIHPVTVLTTLPVAAFGGLATLLLFGSELSLYAYVGIFMLLGIVAKNGIMMVDFANQNLEKGDVTDMEAIYDACLVRFRPILMTGVAAIMGAVPIALGLGADGASRRPLGLIVVGGLIFSQIITLFVTPGIFLYMQSFQEKVLDRFELSRAGSSRKHEEGEL